MPERGWVLGQLKVWRSQVHFGGLSLYFGAQTEMTMNRHTLICIVLFSTLAPAQAPQGQHYVVLSPHSQAVIPPVLLWDKGSYASWTPSQRDIEDLESKLSQISELKIRGWESTKIRIDQSMSRAQLKVAGGGWVDDTTLQLALRRAERR